MSLARFGSFLVAAALVVSVAACSGVKSSSSGGSTSTPTSGTPPSVGGSISTPNIVQVSAGATAGGVNISVPAPAASSPANAELLGVTTTSTGTAQNTGDVIHRGETATVILFGPGLSGSLQVSIAGPNDIQVSNVRSISAKDGTPGIAFTAVVGSGAALGARTVFLQDSQNDITAFAGGLEVMP